MKEDFFDVIKDRLEAWELVEFLKIPIEDILLEFEEEILDNAEELKELLGIKEETNYNDQ